MNKDSENLITIIKTLLVQKGCKINPEYKTKWITALRSGRYAKCKKVLSFVSINTTRSYSALGVLCDIVIQNNPELLDKIIWSSSNIPDEVAKKVWLLKKDIQILLNVLNDEANMSFEDFSTFIEKNM
jgi:hypothetical protein